MAIQLNESQQSNIDPRLLRVSFAIGDERRTYENLAIEASGTKYANETQNDCTVKIYNLNRETRNYLSSQFSPFNTDPRPKVFLVEAGRKSYGYRVLFKGNVQKLSLSQPPDIACTFQTITQANANLDITTLSAPPVIKFSDLIGDFAKRAGLKLRNESTDKSITNYSYSGGKEKEVNRLAQAGDVDVFIDDDTLVVKDKGIPLQGSNRILNAHTGLIGRVVRTQYGIQAKYFLDNTSKLGGMLTIQSVEDTQFNGTYVIYKLHFSVSNRADQFSWTADAIPYNIPT